MALPYPLNAASAARAEIADSAVRVRGLWTPADPAVAAPGALTARPVRAWCLACLENVAHALHSVPEVLLQSRRERDLLLQPIREHQHRVRRPHARNLFKQCALRADLECVRRPDALRRRLLFDGNAHPAHVQ